MTAVRQVVKRHEVELDPRKEFKERIPNSLLFHELPHDRQRIHRLWGQFTISVNALCKTRRNILINKHIRKAVFDSGMERLCKDFSRRNMHVKVEWKNVSNKFYRLVLIRMSVVPDSCLNRQWFVAEIPQPVAQAELVAEIPAQATEREAEFVTPRSAALMAQIVSLTLTVPTPIHVVPMEDPSKDPPFAFAVQWLE